ncbi:MAG: hypothetical protein AAF916_11675, partial [Planctomycetota bacterium]
MTVARQIAAAVVAVAGLSVLVAAQSTRPGQAADFDPTPDPTIDPAAEADPATRPAEVTPDEMG